MSIRAFHWNYNWLEYEKAPFVFTNIFNEPEITWAGFDDVKSFEYKVRFLKEAGLGGAMFFALDSDDHADKCQQGPYPLLRVINHHLNKNIQVEFPDQQKINDKFKTNFELISQKQSFRRFFASTKIANENGNLIVTIAYN